MANGTTNPPGPRDEATRARWRVCLVAYREAARAERDHQACWDFGVKAMQAAFPQIGIEQARSEMSAAIAWVAIDHGDWFNRGVPRREWIWPPTAEGVGLFRHRK